jgi:sulfate permease, SulP family
MSTSPSRSRSHSRSLSHTSDVVVVMAQSPSHQSIDAKTAHVEQYVLTPDHSSAALPTALATPPELDLGSTSAAAAAPLSNGPTTPVVGNAATFVYEPQLSDNSQSDIDVEILDMPTESGRQSAAPFVMDKVRSSCAASPNIDDNPGDIELDDLNDSKQYDKPTSNGVDGDSVSGDDDGTPIKDPMIGEDGRRLDRIWCCGIKYATEPHQIQPYAPERYINNWRSLLKNEVLAGVTVATAQVSDALAFSLVAGVGPLLGLHAAWIIGLACSMFSSRAAMTNASTGVRAAVVAPYITEHGIGMLFYIVMMISVFQILAAMLRLAKLVSLTTRPAMIGFVNGLAIIIFLSQIDQFKKPGTSTFYDSATIWYMLLVASITVLSAWLMPKIPVIGNAIPPSLYGLITSIVIEYAFIRPALDGATPRIEDIGNVDGGFPKLFFLDPLYDSAPGQASILPPFNWDTIKTAAGPAFIAAAAGAVEAVMTIEVASDLTDTPTVNPNQHLVALAVGNFISGLFGTMGGGSTIGPTILNINSGANGHYRISTYVAALTVLLLIVVASPLIKLIPVAGLVGIMAIVCYDTFEWSSIPLVVLAFVPQSVRDRYGLTSSRKILRSDAIVIIVVTVVTLIADLFTAVLIGVLFTAVSFAWSSGKELRVISEVIPTTDADGNPSKKKIIRVDGHVFFASAMKFIREVNVSKHDPPVIEIHFHASQISDFTGLHALNTIGSRYKKLNKELHLKALNDVSIRLLKKADKLAEHFSYQLEEEAADVELPLEAPHQFHVSSSIYHRTHPNQKA